MLVDTISYGLFKTSENNPGLTQRNLVRRLGICIGNIELCLQALVDQSGLEVDNFRSNKLAYSRLSILHGFVHKAHMTQQSTNIKMQASRLCMPKW